MASSMFSGSVKHSPAPMGGYGYCVRSRPLHGGSNCRFGPKLSVAFPPLRASSTAVRSDLPLPEASPPSDFKASPVPLLLVPPYLLDEDKNKSEIEKAEGRYLFYSLPEKEFVTVEKNQKSWRRHQIRDWDDAYWIGSSRGWIMYMTRRDCNLYLCNPFSPSTSPIIALPPIETLPGVNARCLHRRRSDQTSDELDVEFVLEEWYNDKDPDGLYYDEDTDKNVSSSETNEKKWFEFSLPFDPPVTAPWEDVVNRVFVKQFALSSSPKNSSEELRSCIVAITYGARKRLAICRLGDKFWTSMEGESCYLDIIFSNYTNLKLIALTWLDGMKSCQLSPTKSGSDSSPEWNVIPNWEYGEDDEMVGDDYLVESATDPNHLLTVRSSYKEEDRRSYTIKVLKLDLSDPDPNKKWTQVEHLNDQALFVGSNSETLAVPAAQLPHQLKPNCVYFNSIGTCDVGVSKVNKAEYKVKKMVKPSNVFDAIHIDYSLQQKGWSRFIWAEEYRRDAEGWLLWVAPNPW